MSNPFAKTYEDLRRPYLEGKMAKKDYDGDGKVESGAKEYRGVIHNKIQQKMGKKGDGKDTSSVKEHHQKDADGNVIPHGDGTPSSVEEEQLDELKDTTYKSYIDKAQPAARRLSSKREVAKKKQGIERAVDSITGTKKKKPKSHYNIKNYEGQKRQYLVGKEDRRNHKEYGKIPRNDAYREEVEQIDELSKKTLGGYIKKASKETRGNMVATQHGSGIPKKARDIKLKQVSKRLKGMEKAGEKLAKEETVNEISMPKNTSYEKMSYKKLKNTHSDNKNMDSVPPRVSVGVKDDKGNVKYTASRPVKFVPDKKPKSKMKEEFDHIENCPLAEAILGTLHVADMKGNTVAWQNRMDTNNRGERLYEFGQDLINAMAEYVDEAKDTSAMKNYLDAKAKKLEKDQKKQKPEYRNNPAFGDPSHHSNRKNRKETFSNWRSEFIWEDGDSVKKT